MTERNYLRIRGASEHNFRNIDIGSPKNKDVGLSYIKPGQPATTYQVERFSV